jgi:carbamate kinase
MIARPQTPGDGGHSIVVALGGNALLPPGEAGSIQQQFAHTRESLAPIVALAAEGWRIVIVHGNGPQIGDELLRNEWARQELPPLPLGVLVAGTAGWIGYMIQQSLQNALRRARIRRNVATVVTQVLVDAGDEKARVPSKPIGRVMDEATARQLAEELGWSVGETPDGWRRLVASPRPLSIIEAPTIERLLEQGTIVIAAGGGGTPVYDDPALGLEGIDAVVDKDWAAEVLGRDVLAEVLLMLTNVEGVYRDFGLPTQRLIRGLTAAEADRMVESGELGKGSMEPKLEAAAGFVRSGGRRAYIARLDQGLEAVNGRAGTCIELGS